MRREELYLKDIVEAADSIEGFLDNVTHEAFIESDLLRSAVLHKLTIIGEAGIGSFDQPMSFQCQNCREYLNTSMNSCPYCRVTIRHDAALAAASHHASACNSSSFLKVMARAMVVFYLVSWIPIVGEAAGLAFFAMAVIAPVALAVWWARGIGRLVGSIQRAANRRRRF